MPMIAIESALVRPVFSQNTNSITSEEETKHPEKAASNESLRSQEV
jgi:hypothetical protein